MSQLKNGKLESWRAEKEARATFDSEYVMVEAAFTAELAAIGLNKRQIGAVANAAADIDYMIDSGRIVFSSPERESQIRIIADNYSDQVDSLRDQEEEAALEATDATWDQRRW